MSTLDNELAKIPERIERGVVWLNKHHPGWLDIVEVSRLNMQYCTDCVLGQLTGDFWDTFADDSKFAVSIGLTSPVSKRFNQDSTDKYFNALTDVWKKKILNLRQELEPV